MAVKRFLLFAGHDYYPDGGWHDFRGSYESKEEAEKELRAARRTCDWAQIVDVSTGKAWDVRADRARIVPLHQGNKY